ncbi:MAG TPA: hypothetical protein VF407_16455, partial [Polyangiaceae bacterium]
MRRPRVFGFVIGSIVTTLLGVGACGGKILEGSDALLDAGSNDATTVDAVVVDSAPQPGCDSIAGSTKPSGSQKGLFYESAEIFESSSIQGFGVGDV